MKQSFAPNIFEVGKKAGPAQPSQAEVQSAIALFQQGRVAEAQARALDLTKRYPAHGEGWKILGVVLRYTGQLQESLKPMQTACKLMPDDHEAFNNLGSTLQAMNDNHHAQACYRHAIALKPDYTSAVANLAHMLLNEGKRDEALPLFERKLELTPDDDYVVHLVRFMRGEQSERATAQYVTKTFDDYAETFDAHLVEGLRYDAPKRLVELVQQSGKAPAGKWRVLDLGCGTGMVGEAITPFAGELVGVDLSTKMLERARQKNIYQSLICSDILPVLQAEPAASVDVIVSADVFIYIGKIDEIVQQARRVLRGGGMMAFSIEDIEPAADTPADATLPDHQLKPSGRYGQSMAYIDRLAQTHGFQTVSVTNCVLRLESEVPLHGKLVVWQA